MELSDLQKTIFVRCLARVIEEGYGELDNVCCGDTTAADADTDPDDIRCQLADAIGEAAYLAAIESPECVMPGELTAEDAGDLYDLADAEWPALAEYLTATTDMHLNDAEGVQS